MNKLVEKIMYSLGINFPAYNVSRELDLLQKNIPDDFLQRDVVDIGCGDGRLSLKLKQILKPKFFLGIDLSKSLIKSARKRGLNAKVLNIESQTYSGDIGILWGVLHHFNNPVSTLKKINREFHSLIIRESIDDKRLIELGRKMNRKKIMKILSSSSVKIRKIIEVRKNKSLIILTK